MTSPIIRPARRAEAADAAALHATQIHRGYLASLGTRFLERFYARVLRTPCSFLFVADDGRSVVGFVCGTEDRRRLLRSFAIRDGLLAGAAAAPRLLRSAPRAMETLMYASRRSGPRPGKASALPHTTGARAELLSMAVDPAARGTGVGRALAAACVAEFERRGVERARVITAADNAAALRVYEQAGFRRRASREVHAGTVSEELEWP